LRNWSAANSKMHDAVHTKEGKPVDVARFTALRALWITKHNVHLVTSSDKAVSEMWTEGAWQLRPTAPNDGLGLMQLFVLSPACVTTIVGVCMVMKHDGMTVEGWMNFVFNGAMIPYPLCPIWMPGEMGAKDCYDYSPFMNEWMPRGSRRIAEGTRRGRTAHVGITK
jgi:hypothetical protein